VVERRLGFMYLRALKVRSAEAAVTGRQQKMRSRMTMHGNVVARL